MSTLTYFIDTDDAGNLAVWEVTAGRMDKCQPILFKSQTAPFVWKAAKNAVFEAQKRATKGML